MDTSTYMLRWLEGDVQKAAFIGDRKIADTRAAELSAETLNGVVLWHRSGLPQSQETLVSIWVAGQIVDLLRDRPTWGAVPGVGVLLVGPICYDVWCEHETCVDLEDVWLANVAGTARVELA